MESQNIRLLKSSLSDLYLLVHSKMRYYAESGTCSETVRVPHFCPRTVPL